MMRLQLLWLSLVGLLFVHPILAEDKQQPLLTVPLTWSISGARWHSNGHDFWTWSRNYFQNTAGAPDYEDHLQLWNGETGKQENQLNYRSDNVEMILDWSASENRVLIYGGKTIEIWDALRGETVWTRNNDTGRISGARWNADFTQILYWSYDDGGIHIWDTSTGQESFLANTNLPSDLIDVQWSPDEKTVLGVLTQPPGHVELWNVATGQKRWTVEYAGMIYQASFNADGSRILIIGDKIIQLVDATTGNVLHERRDDLFLYRAAWSPNRQLIAVRSENEPVVEIWDALSGKVLFTILESGHTDNNIIDVQWSKNNQSLLTHSSEGIDIWNTASGANLFQLPVKTSPLAIAWLSWSPDNQKMIYLDSDNSLQIVTLSDHSTIELAMPFPIQVSLASPDFTWNAAQTQVMLSGVDGKVRVWNTTSGKLLATLEHPVHEGFDAELVNEAFWSPDEQFILTLGEPSYCGGVDICPTEAMVWKAP